MKDHIHKYMRVYIGSTKVIRGEDGKRHIVKGAGTVMFKCMVPGCPHFKARELCIGAKSICWKCGQEMVLNMENTTLKKPTHRECRRSKVNEGVKIA